MCAWGLSAAVLYEQRWGGRPFGSLPPAAGAPRQLEAALEELAAWQGSLSLLTCTSEPQAGDLPAGGAGLPAAELLRARRQLVEVLTGLRRGTRAEADGLRAWFGEWVEQRAWSGFEGAFWAACACLATCSDAGRGLADLSPAVESLTHWQLYVGLLHGLLRRAQAPPGTRCGPGSRRGAGTCPRGSVQWGGPRPGEACTDQVLRAVREVSCARDLPGCLALHFRTIFCEQPAAQIKDSVVFQKLAAPGQRLAGARKLAGLNGAGALEDQEGGGAAQDVYDPAGLGEDLDLAVLASQVKLACGLDLLAQGLVLLPPQLTQAARQPEPPAGAGACAEPTPASRRPRPCVVAVLGTWAVYDRGPRRAWLCHSLAEAWLWLCYLRSAGVKYAGDQERPAALREYPWARVDPRGLAQLGAARVGELPERLDRCLRDETLHRLACHYLYQELTTFRPVLAVAILHGRYRRYLDRMEQQAARGLPPSDEVGAAFSAVQLVHRVLTDPRVAHADSGYRGAWLLYLQLAGLRPLGPPPARRAGTPDSAAWQELARLAGLPAPFGLLARLLAGGGPAGPELPLPAERPVFARLRQELWPGRQSPLARRWWLQAVKALLFDDPPSSSALAEISRSVRDDRRWQLVVGPELRYVLQALDTLAGKERWVLQALQDVTSTGRAGRSALRAQVLSRLSVHERWGPLAQLKGLEGRTTAAAAAGAEELCGFLATATGKLLLLDDYLLPRQLFQQWSVDEVLRFLAPEPGYGPLSVPPSSLRRVLPGLLDAQARRTPRQPGLLEQKFTNCFFNSALQFLAALLCPPPAGRWQCQDRGCLACCLVRCAELLQGPKEPVVVQYVERSYGRQGAILHVPDHPAILQAFEALSLGVRDRGRSADQPQMYELKTDSAAACVGTLLERALAPTTSSRDCGIRSWLEELFRVRYGLLGAGTEGEAPRQGPLLILGWTPQPHSAASNSVTLQNVLDGALPRRSYRAAARVAVAGDAAGNLTLDFVNTRPNVLVRLAGSVKPVEFWLESACFRLEHTKPEHFVVVRRVWGGDGVHSGWHCLGGERLVSGSLWQALEGVTAGRQDAPGQRPPRPVMFLLRRRQSRMHLTIVGDAAQQIEYELDHREWTRGVRAALTAGMPHFADLWPPERPLSKSSLIFVRAGRAGTSTTVPPRGPAKPAGAGPSGLAPAGSSDARRRRTAAPA
eukprot:g13449.t1